MEKETERKERKGKEGKVRRRERITDRMGWHIEKSKESL